jgi:hypothetical protein
MSVVMILYPPEPRISLTLLTRQAAANVCWVALSSSVGWTSCQKTLAQISEGSSTWGMMAGVRLRYVQDHDRQESRAASSTTSRKDDSIHQRRAETKDIGQTNKGGWLSDSHGPRRSKPSSVSTRCVHWIVRLVMYCRHRPGQLLHRMCIYTYVCTVCKRH